MSRTPQSPFSAAGSKAAAVATRYALQWHHSVTHRTGRVRAIVKEAEGLDRLPAGAGQWLDALVALVEGRVAYAAQLALPPRTLRQRLEARKTAAAERQRQRVMGPLAKAYGECGYRRSKSRWVGGHHNLGGGLMAQHKHRAAPGLHKTFGWTHCVRPTNGENCCDGSSHGGVPAG